MNPHPIPLRSPPPSTESGIALVEVLIAAVVLTVGILGLIGAFTSAGKLTLLSERRTAMAHRAQLEIERLQAYTYSELAMASAPAHSAETSNPDYAVNYSSPVKCTSVGDGCYAWNAENLSGEEEPLVYAKNGECTSIVLTECGVISTTPSGRKCSTQVGACEWADGLVTGNVYDFVTWHTDKCAKCVTTNSYKRITVVVTVKVSASNHAVAPVRVSTLIAEPS